MSLHVNKESLLLHFVVSSLLIVRRGFCRAPNLFVIALSPSLTLLESPVALPSVPTEIRTRAHSKCRPKEP